MEYPRALFMILFFSLFIFQLLAKLNAGKGSN